MTRRAGKTSGGGGSELEATVVRQLAGAPATGEESEGGSGDRRREGEGRESGGERKGEGFELHSGH